MGRNYQGHGTKSKHSTVNRYQDQSKSPIPPPVPVVLNFNFVAKIIINVLLIYYTFLLFTVYFSD